MPRSHACPASRGLSPQQHGVSPPPRSRGGPAAPQVTFERPATARRYYAKVLKSDDSIYTTTGTVTVAASQAKASQEFTLDTTGWPAGMYRVRGQRGLRHMLPAVPPCASGATWHARFPACSHQRLVLPPPARRR